MKVRKRYIIKIIAILLIFGAITVIGMISLANTENIFQGFFSSQYDEIIEKNFGAAFCFSDELRNIKNEALIKLGVKEYNGVFLLENKLIEDYTPPGGQLTKVPTLILGAGVGDPQDPDIGKGFIRKGTSSFDLWLHGAADNGVFIGQYTDIVGERKPTNINLSDWDSGEFTVMYDGNIAQNYYVVFDAGDRPTIIIDATGHETVVTWE